jgi:hypothetical protein
MCAYVLRSLITPRVSYMSNRICVFGVFFNLKKNTENTFSLCRVFFFNTSYTRTRKHTYTRALTRAYTRKTGTAFTMQQMSDKLNYYQRLGVAKDVSSLLLSLALSMPPSSSSYLPPHTYTHTLSLSLIELHVTFPATPFPLCCTTSERMCLSTSSSPVGISNPQTLGYTR